MSVVIFDLDGTLANIEHRRIHLSGSSPDWKAFNSEMGNDTPNTAIVDLYKSLWSTNKYKLIIVSGRSDEFRPFTVQWLTWNEIPFNELIMRDRHDFSQDYMVKEKILNKIRSRGEEIAFVVDDRQQVVDMWRRNGITCLQCDYGDF